MHELHRQYLDILCIIGGRLCADPARISALLIFEEGYSPFCGNTRDGREHGTSSRTALRARMRWSVHGTSARAHDARVLHEVLYEQICFEAYMPVLVRVRAMQAMAGAAAAGCGLACTRGRQATHFHEFAWRSHGYG